MCKIEEDGFCGIWGDRLQESNLRWRQMTWQSKKIRKKNIDFNVNPMMTQKLEIT